MQFVSRSHSSLCSLLPHSNLLKIKSQIIEKQFIEPPYIEARKLIYLPTYQWMLEHKVADIIARLREASRRQTIVLLDYNTNPDVDDPSHPLSHVFLVKAYAEGLYPYGTPHAADGIQMKLL